MNIRPLLRLVCTRFLGDMCGLVDMCVTHIPSPLAHAATKVQHVYTGHMDSPLAQDMFNCDPDVIILTFINPLQYYKFDVNRES